MTRSTRLASLAAIAACFAPGCGDGGSGSDGGAGDGGGSASAKGICQPTCDRDCTSDQDCDMASGQMCCDYGARA